MVVTEPDSDRADALFEEWADEGKELIAPAFFEVETDSILRQKATVRRELSAEQAEAAVFKLQALPIQQFTVSGQRKRAWEIAAEFGASTVYDATYLELAELHGCEFWTADQRLFNQVKDRLSYVRFLGAYAPR
jgi:predicted nucleic acid-binding protein